MASLERVASHRAASCSQIISPVRFGRWQSVVHVSRLDRRVALPSRVLVSAAAADVPQQGAPITSSTPYVPTAHQSIDEDNVLTSFIAETLLPTRHGKFRLRGYKHSTDGGATFTEPTAIVSGKVEGQEDVAVRVHDACFTSEVLGSLKCDCAEQLELALRMIQGAPPGIVIYLQQEGRGIGLANKIAAYSLQEQGLDTVDANRALGLPDDCREYTSVRNMLQDMGVKSIRLITNNPRKINTLTKLGIQVNGRIPCLVAAGAYNQGYLEAKRDRMAHMLPEEEALGSSLGGPEPAAAAAQRPNGAGVEAGELNGDFCFWDHSGEPTQAVATVYAKGGMDLPQGLAHGDNGRVVPVAAAPAGSSSGSDAGSS
ncbi:hypothetical protein CHLRE_09g393900v5 [Chlamydomonas reinhardtii]|uniref:GTP cyclohydrolase II n=1 Tax=Chlamydomonas reinhardtii TaxID=3055 RepID=A8IZV5_CHLRE|nr:uncharacterized protein CHLRE_09g393900v5 [Chlamydomonas reinhardtii]PNW78519.1 hypothetical protein CHLRE_09g393900v5 [Chlamydomonas reinhardtii]|eukprot:XP_001694594.1 bifunctional GTP cyclohydrolase II [Chlamydomonas reinhardtii]